MILKVLRLGLLLIAGISAGFAEDRALIVGVGRYVDTQNNLPGIEKDLASVREVVSELGFRANQVHVLTNEGATEGAIRRELEGWLAGAGPDDRALFYYSGHGSLMKDSSGQVVGILAPHDIELRGGVLVHGLPGPELGDLFRHMPSRHLLVVVDACHSGRLTDARGFGNGVVAKVFRYANMPTEAAGLSLEGPVASKGILSGAGPNYVLLSACRRDEIAGATAEGSILTVALAETLRQMLAAGRPVTMKSAHTAIGERVRNGQHPEISGSIVLNDYDWAGRDMVAEPVAQTGDDWVFLNTLYRRRDTDLAIDIGKTAYRPGDKMSISMVAPADGYINVVSMGRGDGTATVLFPNERARDNHVMAGRVELPGVYGFSLEQELPPGVSSQENELIVVFTTRAVSFYDEGVGSAMFRNLGERTRGTVVRAGNHFAAGFANYLIGR
jgi:hypothetical protein